MQTPREPRFHVQSAVKIAAIDQPENVTGALLVDVSGAGMKLIADRDWPVDSRLVVETENHLVLARVRNSASQGSQFSLGAEKTHSILKLALPPGTHRAEWHRMLLASLDPASPLAPPSQIHLPVDSSLDPPQDLRTADARTLDLLTVELLTRDLERLEEKSDEPPAAATGDEKGSAAEAATPTAAPAFVPQATREPFEPPSYDEPAAARAEKPNANRRWMIFAALLAGFAGVIAIAVYVETSGPRPAGVSSQTATKVVAVPEAAPAAARAPVNASPARSAAIPTAPAAIPTAPAPGAGARHAIVKTSAMNWVSACSDGTPVFAKLLAAGEARAIDFQHTAVIRVGNAGAAEIDVDGKSIGSLGAPGELKIAEIGPSGLRWLPQSLSPEAECKASGALARRP